MNKSVSFLSALLALLTKSPHRHFQTKILWVTVGGALVGMLLTVAISFLGLTILTNTASTNVETSLEATNKTQLKHHLKDTAQQINLWMGHTQADLHILADITQKLIDQQENFTEINQILNQNPFFADTMIYNPSNGYAQNQADSPTVLMAEANLYDETGQLKPHPQALIQNTALLNLVMPSIQQYGASKINVYFVGGEEANFIRMAPWSNLGNSLYNHNTELINPTMLSHYADIYRNWQTWLTNLNSAENHLAEITALAPYLDSKNNRIIQTYAHPIWNKERTDIIGSVWYDIEIETMINYIEQVQLYQTGFAFLVQGDGNVFVISEQGSELLGLNEKAYQDEDNNLYRYLANSTEPDIATLTLPQDDEALFLDITITDKSYNLVMHRLNAISLWQYQKDISLEYWAVGFIVPYDEVYTPLLAAQQSINQSSKYIFIGQIIVFVIIILILIGLTYIITKQITANLVMLTNSANQIIEGNYDINLSIKSQDEFKQLGDVFTTMAQRLKNSFINLEVQNLKLKQAVEEHKQTAIALQKSEERYRTLVEQAADGIFISDAQGYCVDINSSGCALVGYSRSEILQMHISQLILEEEITEQQQNFKKLLAGETVLSERQLKHKSGLLVPAEINAKLLPNGKLQAIIRDITNRKQAAQKIKQLNQELEQRVKDRTAQLKATNQELEAFAYSVSHDLRTPLRHIEGFINLLIKHIGNQLDDTSTRYTQIIIDSVDKMAELIEALLTLSRLGRAEMKVQAVDLNQLLKQVQYDLTPETKERNIIWHIEPLPMVKGDVTMLKIVWTNLFLNAIKYTAPREQAKIKVGLTTSKPTVQAELTTKTDITLNNQWVTIYIQDNGVGFNPQYLSKLFGVFQRLHSESEFEGIGIGLATVRRIIHRHGGQVWAEGATKQGATFYIKLRKHL